MWKNSSRGNSATPCHDKIKTIAYKAVMMCGKIAVEVNLLHPAMIKSRLLLTRL